MEDNVLKMKYELTVRSYTVRRPKRGSATSVIVARVSQMLCHKLPLSWLRRASAAVPFCPVQAISHILPPYNPQPYYFSMTSRMPAAIPRDIREFLDDYPDNTDDRSRSDNLLFYSNRLRCRPDNLRIDDLHKQ